MVLFDIFSLINKYDLDKPIHKVDFIRFLPNSLATVNDNNSIIQSVSQETTHKDVYKKLKHITRF